MPRFTLGLRKPVVLGATSLMLLFGCLSAPDETSDLCNPGDLAQIMDGLAGGGELLGGDANAELIQQMLESPTDGPIYMVNLIRYRELAEYADGRETDLTGREANALYAPAEFLAAIGARVVFSADVDMQIDGDDTVWEEVDIVEYPCVTAFLSMLADPEFQARAIHKDAGVEKTIVMVTDLEPSQFPVGLLSSDTPYPATEEDPAFELIHVKDYHEIAQYEDGADEPERTGEEAWQMYQSNGAAAGGGIGSYPTAVLRVRGVLQGDDRSWDEVQIVHMPSMAGFEALLDNETRQQGRYHRYAALANNYSLITYPTVLDIPSNSDSVSGALLGLLFGIGN
jgi:hypothetical protein